MWLRSCQRRDRFEQSVLWIFNISKQKRNSLVAWRARQLLLSLRFSNLFPFWHQELIILHILLSLSRVWRTKPRSSSQIIAFHSIMHYCHSYQTKSELVNVNWIGIEKDQSISISQSINQSILEQKSEWKYNIWQLVPRGLKRPAAWLHASQLVDTRHATCPALTKFQTTTCTQTTSA